MAAVAVALVWAATATAASYVYDTAWNAAKVDEYVEGANGVLTEIGSVDTLASSPWYMAMTAKLVNPVTHIHLESLYAVTFSGEVISFGVGTNGKLVHKPAAQGGQLPAGSEPYGIALSPDDRNAYVPDYLGSAVSVFDVLANGGIKVHSPAAVAAGTYPEAVAVGRDGKSVYVGEENDIRQFTRLANGSLTPKSPATVASGTYVDWLALTPDGKHLYAANSNDGTIGIYSVAANGTLTQQGSPVPTGATVYEMAVSPDGKSLYAADQAGMYVYQYTIEPNGSLLAKSPSTVSGGTNLGGIWISPSGRSAYVPVNGAYMGGNYTGDTISQFSLGPTGLLSPFSPPTVGTDNYAAALAITPDLSPTASFTDSGTGLTEKFDGSGSRDTDGSVKLYRWSFGDGALSQTTKPQVSHAYKHAGTYTVSLTVTDNAGCSVPMVWTGQMAYCDGSTASTIAHLVTVK